MQSSSFKITVWLAFALFLFILGWVLISLFTSTESDQNAYHALLKETQPANSPSPVTPYTAQQERHGGQKDLIFTKGQERLQLHLTNTAALMVLEQTAEGTLLIEKMQGVKCWMQEELFYQLPDGKEAFKQANGKLLVRGGDAQDPQAWFSLAEGMPMQILRYLEADSATYAFKSDDVVATQVKIARYKLPGHAMTFALQGIKPHFKGTAAQAEFSMAGGEPRFKAHKLKASYTRGEL